MRRRTSLAALLASILWALALACAAQPAPATPGAGTLDGAALLHALRQGGYVLYLRHASTDFGQNDDAMTDYANCAQQRNLTDAGRAEARAIGRAIRDLGIPVGPILASPYCRTRESAELVFGKPTVSQTVRGGPASDDGGQRYAALRALLSTPVAKGSNLAISSHGNPFRALAGTPYLQEGEIAVIEPLGNGRFAIVARITNDAWPALVERFR
ncbi:MAG: histidine phosphatase family protein [Burkholderiales bacterium]